jgi:hypothetical protein
VPEKIGFAIDVNQQICELNATQARLNFALECAHRVRGWLSAQSRQEEVSPLAINREPLILGYTIVDLAGDCR